MSENKFEELNHSDILSVKSKDDKNVTLTIGVYRGNTSINVFTGAGGRPWKHPLPRKSIPFFVNLLRKMRDDPKPRREPVFLNKYEDGENGRGRMKQCGCIGFGISDDLKVYIDVSSDDLNGRHLFPIRPDSRFDFSNTVLSEKDLVVSTIDSLIELLSSTTETAERLSAFKGAPGGNFGGGSKGSSKSGNYSGNNSRGNYSNDRNSFNRGNESGGSNNRGNADIEDDLHI